MTHDLPPQEPSPIEVNLRRRWERGEFTEAAAEWIEAYGPEVLTFFGAVASTRADAPAELFSAFCEALLVSLPDFRWECTARTWSYRLARNEWHRSLRRSYARRLVPLSDAPAVLAAVEQVRSSTAIERRTSVKDRFRALREELPDDDQMLLILRVDRGLDWLEAARVMTAETHADEEVLARVSARLRKRFQRIKTRIRELAEERGLVPADD